MKKSPKENNSQFVGCSQGELRAIELALKHKGNLALLVSLKEGMEFETEQNQYGPCGCIVWQMRCG